MLVSVHVLVLAADVRTCAHVTSAVCGRASRGGCVHGATHYVMCFCVVSVRVGVRVARLGVRVCVDG